MARDLDPPRLSELPAEEPDGLRWALSEARRAGPDAAARGRIAAGLGAALGRPPAPATPAWDRGSLWRSLALGAGLATVVVIGSLGWRAHTQGSRAGMAPGALVGRPVMRVTAPPRVRPGAAVERSASEPAPALEPAPVPEAEPAATLRLPARPALPAAPRHAGTRLAAASAASPRRPAVPSEGELLRRAQEALRDEPGRALALVSQHATLYPAGALAQERDVIAVEALERLGRRNDARAAAQAFLARHPDSPHREHVEALLRRADSSPGIASPAATSPAATSH